jgi:hypothetical protein
VWILRQSGNGLTCPGRAGPTGLWITKTRLALAHVGRGRRGKGGPSLGGRPLSPPGAHWRCACLRRLPPERQPDDQDCQASRGEREHGKPPSRATKQICGLSRPIHSRRARSATGVISPHTERFRGTPSPRSHRLGRSLLIVKSSPSSFPLSSSRARQTRAEGRKAAMLSAWTSIACIDRVSIVLCVAQRCSTLPATTRRGWSPP